MTRLVAQIVKELLALLRDSQSRLQMIGPPLIQLFVLSSAATLEVRNVDLAILDDDAGRASHEMIERVAASYFVGNLVFVDSPQRITELIDRREVLAGLHFPADFSRDVAAQRPATLQVLIDGRRANAGQITLSYLQSIAAEYGASVRGNAAAIVPQAEVRHWFNENLLYVWFIVPAMTGVLVMFNGLTVTALSIAREREQGTFDQLMVSPLTPFEIVVAKSVPAFIVGTTLSSLMIAASVFVFRIPLAGSLTLLLLSVMLFILAMVGIGLMVSSICQTQQQAILGAFAVGYPMIMISGFATPVENMPHWLQVVAQASPLKHFLVIIQGSFVKAMPVHDVLANAWPMMVIALVTMSAAIAFVQRRLQ